MVNYLKDIIDLEPYIGTAPFCGIRLNPLKPAELRIEGLEKSGFYEYGYRIPGEEKCGKDIFHSAGAYYIQEPSAMSAITALDVRHDDIVLDMCAAPGSKATAIAAQCGMLVANEINRKRAMTLIGNIERMGISNTLVLNSETSAVADAFEGYFDKVLVDSPCSGEGMFRKHPEIPENWTPELVSMCAERSKAVLQNASRALKPGGRLVYSTCTYNLEENEKLILEFLDNNPDFEAIDTGLDFGDSGMLGLDKARRISIKHGGEGHFVCALTRNGDCRRAFLKPFKLKQNFNILKGITSVPPRFLGQKTKFGMLESGNTFFALPVDMPYPKGVYILRAGVKACTISQKTLKPEHHLFMAANPDCFLQKTEVTEENARLFLGGQVIGCENGLRGWCAVMYNGLCLGFGKAADGVLKNHYPKGLR